MFRRENRRFLMLVLAILILSVVTLVCMTVLIYHNMPSPTTFLTGFVTIIIVQLISMARQEQNNEAAELRRQVIQRELAKAATAAQEAKKEASEVKVVINKISQESGQNLVRTVGKVADKVRAAERDQLLDEMNLPKTEMELRRVLSEMVDSACNEKVASVAETTARTTVAELKREGMLKEEKKV